MFEIKKYVQTNIHELTKLSGRSVDLNESDLENKLDWGKDRLLEIRDEKRHGEHSIIFSIIYNNISNRATLALWMLMRLPEELYYATTDFCNSKYIQGNPLIKFDRHKLVVNCERGFCAEGRQAELSKFLQAIEFALAKDENLKLIHEYENLYSCFQHIYKVLRLPIPKRFLPFKTINDTQKNILDGTMHFIFDDISTLNNSDATQALKAILKKSLSIIELIKYRRLNVLDSIIQAREILSHSHPQNRSTDYPYFGKPSDDTSLVVYKGLDDKPAFEPRGLLSLTARNDEETMINKAAVVEYISELISKEIERYQLKLLTNFSLSGASTLFSNQDASAIEIENGNFNQRNTK